MKVYQLCRRDGLDSTEYYHLCLHKNKQTALVCFEREVTDFRDFINQDDEEEEEGGTSSEIDYENCVFEDVAYAIHIWIEELELEE